MASTWPEKLEVRPLTSADAADVSTWRYGGDWAVYDSRPEAGPLKADNGYWAVAEGGGGPLVGFCCLGFDARVPGLDAVGGIEDVGVGMRPELTGRGYGAAFATTVLDFARAHAGTTRLRLVVQSWNIRSLRLWWSLGFTQTGRHIVVQDGREVEYIVLESG